MKERIKAAAILASAYLVYVAVLSLMYGCKPELPPTNNDIAGAVSMNQTAQTAATKLDWGQTVAALKKQMPMLGGAQDYIDKLFVHDTSVQQELETAKAKYAKEIQAEKDKYAKEVANFWSLRQRELFWTVLIGCALVAALCVGVGFATGNGGLWVLRLLTGWLHK